MVKKFDWYKADDEKVHFKRRKPTSAKIKHGVKPGQVLVILAGRFRGKRVVFLKQLDSGLLLVTGPYKVNGVPLKRMPQKLTLATSKIISLEGVNTDKINDSYFRKDKKKAGSKEEQFFQDGKIKKPEIPQDKKDTQTEVDAALLKTLKGSLEAKYLKDVFTLHNGQKPHELVF
mmetsp:Transcript_10486/g.11769  ORF Transcript_10486/g.11769 Transcript_10486/m.11769 type:complete len:174 (-) Transcript_10486:81-602(-)